MCKSINCVCTWGLREFCKEDEDFRNFSICLAPKWHLKEKEYYKKAVGKVQKYHITYKTIKNMSKNRENIYETDTLWTHMLVIIGFRKWKLSTPTLLYAG